jgi:hypothetical protein
MLTALNLDLLTQLEPYLPQITEFLRTVRNPLAREVFKLAVSKEFDASKK